METYTADCQNCHHHHPGSNLGHDLNIQWLILLFHQPKTIPLTSQLVSFGLSNQMVVTFKEENLMTFKHLFLKNYVDGIRDTYAVYRQDDVYDHIDYIIEQVSSS